MQDRARALCYSPEPGNCRIYCLFQPGCRPIPPVSTAAILCSFSTSDFTMRAQDQGTSGWHLHVGVVGSRGASEGPAVKPAIGQARPMQLHWGLQLCWS